MKNYSLGMIVRFFPAIAAYQLAWLLFCLKNGMIAAYLSGLAQAVGALPQLIEKRRRMRGNKAVLPVPMFAAMIRSAEKEAVDSIMSRRMAAGKGNSYSTCTVHFFCNDLGKLPMPIPVHIIIVTHNSAGVIDICLSHIEKQTAPIKSVIIIDSGSDNPEHLDCSSHKKISKLIKTENIGFSRANNLGFQEVVGEREGLVIFMNPDTFLPADYISQAIQVMQENPGVGLVSGKLLGFDLKVMKPTGLIDSAGIFRKWYGRWHDRGQGEEDSGQYALIGESLPPPVVR